MSIKESIVKLLPEMRAFARFLTKNVTISDDIVQETVVKALAHLDGFEPGTNLKAWLFTIERNVFYEYLRKSKREVEGLQAWEEQTQITPSSITGKEMREVYDLQQKLWKLSPLLREALVLVGAQQLTYEEAAHICGVGVGTFKARVSRARAELAAMMSSDEKPR